MKNKRSHYPGGGRRRCHRRRRISDLPPPDLSKSIVIPFIAHQKTRHRPASAGPTPLSDKLDEVQFDGLFDLSANPSGIVYQDGLGELAGVDQDNVVTVHLKANKRWSDSYQITAKDDQYTVSRSRDHFFSPADLQFTIRRILTLGSLSPDYILLIQAMESPGFEGPDDKGNIRFRFRQNRIWKDADIKESLSFKIIPEGSAMNALNYTIGTAAYMPLPRKTGCRTTAARRTAERRFRASSWPRSSITARIRRN